MAALSRAASDLQRRYGKKPRRRPAHVQTKWRSGGAIRGRAVARHHDPVTSKRNTPQH